MAEIIESKRLPRSKRVLNSKLAFRIQDRDREILKLVYDYRYLTTDLIKLLISGSSDVINRRLQKLYHNRYLDRVKVSMYEPFVYALDNNGADELAIPQGIDRGKIDWKSKNREAKGMFMDHTLMISCFRAVLTSALIENQSAVIDYWIPEGDFKESVIMQENGLKNIKAPLIPDSFFTLDDNGFNTFFFLEADRSTMDGKRFLNKMKAYWHYWTQGRFEEKIKEWVEMPKGERISFRVLTVCKSEERKDNLRAQVQNINKNGAGSKMFWFTFEKNYSPENPASILGPIWQTAKDDGLHCILE